MVNLKTNKRLKTLIEKAKSGIDALYTTEISKFEEHTLEKKGDSFAYSISFEGGSEHLKYNVIINAIGAIGKIKEHIRDIEQNGDVETFINKSKELSLIMDLWNIDKHGYPLKQPRTQHYPIIDSIRSGLSGYREGGIIKYGNDEDNLATAKNMAIKISFNIVDKNTGKVLSDGDALLKSALEQIQDYISTK
ncbi:MAG: hypothetical protein UU64_C0007G0033 [candidate division WWE3 bacterium GW2011_GWF2_41_45]|uniref:Uncharacterized protein n=3 Tax=Katanobacteria TaxID=422282 RepID=A0A1F4VZM7_UNCKA|nr:MAG: hypothetical protein UU55_C0008G0001 [candidate division WWE3 bacterium GW2011_GWC2_41_23]KKS10220.1 MAG: hypothetical protein UU64_C0007G0033 [candidate division WWE3 bacterium GW2011_GWF2_41_45]KKS19962.1 MAG: hypothetical protein UU79_C0006G0001 [candidate division WWE3 bacterium GW2011_GWE1_41_72]KKS29118.1 MAG: hypothetical protein UU90_C0012G0001 [candidate division WWE3 bacterium GW2011_GWD2_42_11]KKS50508.1 MAG: hypothetical protein UV16_C0010G0017 [candidate division WWE3 bacte